MNLYGPDFRREDFFPPREQYRPSIREGLKLGKNPLKSKTDPLGSYTGNPETDLYPTQDADDL